MEQSFRLSYVHCSLPWGTCFRCDSVQDLSHSEFPKPPMDHEDPRPDPPRESKCRKFGTRRSRKASGPVDNLIMHYTLSLSDHGSPLHRGLENSSISQYFGTNPSHSMSLGHLLASWASTLRSHSSRCRLPITGRRLFLDSILFPSPILRH